MSIDGIRVTCVMTNTEIGRLNMATWQETIHDKVRDAQEEAGNVDPLTRRIKARTALPC